MTSSLRIVYQALAHSWKKMASAHVDIDERENECDDLEMDPSIILEP